MDRLFDRGHARLGETFGKRTGDDDVAFSAVLLQLCLVEFHAVFSRDVASMASLHGVHERPDIPQGVGARAELARVAFPKMGHVVFYDRGVNTGLVECLHGLHHVEVALADECFREFRDRAGYTPKVDVEDLAAATEVADGVENIFRHSADRPRAKGQAVGVARHDLDESLQRRVTAEYSGDLAMGEMGGSSGCSAIWTPASSATGITTLRK